MLRSPRVRACGILAADLRRQPRLVPANADKKLKSVASGARTRVAGARAEGTVWPWAGGARTRRRGASNPPLEKALLA
jgi:hypothetical protein